jgi:glyoxylase-like metal-dependent hydrolase (beta-lactamase superfamily II)
MNLAGRPTENDMKKKYTQGLHEIGQNCWAWLQPDGGWGWTNAGLITDGEHSLMVDTLYDLKMTETMLAGMRDVSPAAKKIDILVNSHADGDHTFGNQLVGNARIIASAATASEFFKVSPETHLDIIKNADILGEGARYIRAFIRDHGFDYSGIQLVPPTETYEREMALKVGDKDVRLINVGPAHTAGDTLVHSVQDRVVYTADILFIGVHPAIWEGSVERWIAACDLILGLDVDVIVPGHGPLTDKDGVRLFRAYLQTVLREARLRYEAGMNVEEAAADIVFEPPFDSWILPERVVGSINFLYRQWGSPHAVTDFMKIFDMVARYAARRADCLAGEHSPGCGHAH